MYFCYYLFLNLFIDLFCKLIYPGKSTRESTEHTVPTSGRARNPPFKLICPGIQPTGLYYSDANTNHILVVKNIYHANSNVCITHMNVILIWLYHTLSVKRDLNWRQCFCFPWSGWLSWSLTMDWTQSQVGFLSSRRSPVSPLITAMLHIVKSW